MVMSPRDPHPMWAPLEALTRAALPLPPRCRIAMDAETMRAVLAVLAGLEVDAVRLAVWDTPEALLGDDGGLAERVRGAGLPVAMPSAPYAERAWDARESLEGAAHRFHDHAEPQLGATAFEPPAAVLVVGGPQALPATLARLLECSPAGIVLDARALEDLRAFTHAGVPKGQALLVGRAETALFDGAEVLGAL